MAKVKLFLILVVGFFVVAQGVNASADITNAVLNGAGTIVSESGQKITATVTVDLSGGSLWKSTAYNFGGEDWTCVDTVDYLSGVGINESFEITAPMEPGTKKVNFKIFEQNGCDKELAFSSATASLLTAFINFFHLGNLWLWVFVAIVAILILVYILKFLFVKKK